MIDLLLVAKLAPLIPHDTAAAWASAFDDALQAFDVYTPRCAAAFLANVTHESQGLARLDEDLHYSAKRLAQVWPHRYAIDPRAIDKQPNELALRIGGNPQLVGNTTYELMNGNGPASSGHGYLYRGRYPIMLTGRRNYEAAYDALGIPDLANPDALLSDIPGMAQVSVWFFKANGCEHYAEKGDFDGVCDVINRGRKTPAIGDSIGFTDRLGRYRLACALLGVA